MLHPNVDDHARSLVTPSPFTRAGGEGGALAPLEPSLRPSDERDEEREGTGKESRALPAFVYSRARG